MARRRVGLGSLVGLLAVFFFGIGLLQRMWTFHAALSLAQGNAAHLEKLYESSLDETADWRNKYDVDMKQVTEALEEKVKLIQDLEAKIENLKKTKEDLEVKMAVLKEELFEEKEKCEKVEKSESTQIEDRDLQRELICVSKFIWLLYTVHSHCKSLFPCRYFENLERIAQFGQVVQPFCVLYQLGITF
ncbi:hypothetical protein GOP47_0017446 [Adiantum capillus-veneris]|uniref:Uncharacterized protein n=1 Tax=Adiantum capillus-veneris TaxID=13818 RepID=A0A9D4UG88_ADICA|nr:hypothetical protein GOP47_0017446 [Adiantum capillus-veneris]